MSLEKLITLANKFEGQSGLTKLADKIENKLAKEKSKPNPKAEVRNRGKVVFPAESSKVKDKKDHYPINDADQARNALARCHQHKSVPPWYKGTLKELQETVSKKVHKEYPSIGKSKSSSSKKKSAEYDYELLKLSNFFKNSSHINEFEDDYEEENRDLENKDYEKENRDLENEDYEEEKDKDLEYEGSDYETCGVCDCDHGYDFPLLSLDEQLECIKKHVLSGDLKKDELLNFIKENVHSDDHKKVFENLPEHFNKEKMAKSDIDFLKLATYFE